MRKCEECGNELTNEAAAFCSSCGAAAASDSEPANEEGGYDKIGETFKTDVEPAEGAAAQPAAAHGEPPGEAGDQTPLVLEFNDNQFYMKDCSGVLEFAISSRCGRTIRQLSLSVKSDDIDRARLLHNLQPAERREIPFRLEPSTAGKHFVDVTVTCRCDEAEEAFSATRPFSVLKDSEAPKSISVHYDHRIQADGSAAVYSRSDSAGSSRIDEQIENDIKDGSVSTINDLVGKDLPDNWVPVRLYPAAHLLDADSVEPKGGDQSDTDPLEGAGPLRLLNKNLGIDITIERDTVIGRTSGAFSGIFGRYEQVSGKHLRISREPLKGWVVTDLDSFNGTKYNDKKLEPNRPQAVSDGAFLHIANIEFYLEIIRPQAGRTGTKRV